MRTSLAPIQRLGFSERSPKRWESSLGRSSSRLLEAITCWRRSFGLGDRLPIHRAAEKGSSRKPAFIHPHTYGVPGRRQAELRVFTESPGRVLLGNSRVLRLASKHPS